MPSNITPLTVQSIPVISVPASYTISSEHRTCGYVKPKAKFAVMSLPANMKTKTTIRITLVRQFRLFLLDENHSLRMKNSQRTFAVLAKFPVLLPPNHHFTTLVVKPHPNPRRSALLDSESSSVSQEVATSLRNVSQS